MTATGTAPRATLPYVVEETGKRYSANTVAAARVAVQGAKRLGTLDELPARLRLIATAKLAD